jgi:rRNA-processing protein EBP2
MVVAGTKTAETLADVNDDLARETHFYEHALRSAEVAIKNLKEIGVAVKRPTTSTPRWSSPTST